MALARSMKSKLPNPFIPLDVRDDENRRPAAVLRDSALAIPHSR
jgi:hypothetical protein